LLLLLLLLLLEMHQVGRRLSVLLLLLRRRVERLRHGLLSLAWRYWWRRDRGRRKGDLQSQAGQTSVIAAHISTGCGRRRPHRLLKEAHGHELGRLAGPSPHGKDDHAATRLAKTDVAHRLFAVEVAGERVVALLAPLAVGVGRAGLMVRRQRDAGHPARGDVALDLIQLEGRDGREV
jgi:hypothetical protein